MTTILTVIIGLACLWVTLFYVLPYVVARFGKSYFVRAVTTEEPECYGQIRLKQGKLQIRNISLKSIAITDLEVVEGYLTTTAGLEEESCVDLLFSNGRKICFDGSKTDQQDLVNEIKLTGGHSLVRSRLTNSSFIRGKLPMLSVIDMPDSKPGYRKTVQLRFLSGYKNERGESRRFSTLFF